MECVLTVLRATVDQGSVSRRTSAHTVVLLSKRMLLCVYDGFCLRNGSLTIVDALECAGASLTPLMGCFH